MRDLQAVLGKLDYSSIVLATGFVVLFFNSGSRYAFGLMLKPMTDDLGWSRSELSLALAAFMLVSALAMPFAGRLADRYSIRLVLAAGGLVVALGIGLTGQVQSQWQLFVAYGLVYAVGHAATSIPTVSVMISRWFVRRRGLANSVALSGNAIGQLVIITVLASLLSSLGWRTSYAVLGAANLVIVVPLALAAARSRPPESCCGPSSNTEHEREGDAGSPTPPAASLLKIYSLIRANFHVLRSIFSSFTNIISPIFGCLEICDHDSLCEVVNSLLVPSNNLVSTLPRIGLIV